MNVVIVNPPNIDRESYIARSADRWPHRVKRGRLFSHKMFPKYPLYLMYGAASLEKGGFKVTVIDAAERDYDIPTTINLIKKIEPVPVLTAIEISAPSSESDLKFAQELKENVDTHITLLGAHATVYHEELVRNHIYIDSVIRGEFFLSLAELAKSLRNESNKLSLSSLSLRNESSKLSLSSLSRRNKADLSRVKGITYLKNNEVQINEDMPLVEDLDSLPLPARHLLDPGRYLMGHYTYEPQLLMVTSMGCPYKCIFCLWPKVLYRGKIRFRSPESIAEEMPTLKDKYGAREIYFDDDCFNITVERVMDVCNAIIKKKVAIPWITEMRCDKVTYQMLQTMKKAGCIKILYGVESGNQAILDRAKKNTTLKQIKNAFKWTKKVGIKSHATYMFGLPGETIDTIKETMEFSRELKSDTIQCSIALPYPGTEFYNLAKKNGTLKVNDWVDFDGELCGAVEYPNLSKGYIQESIGKMYKQYYIRPQYIINRILSIRSWADVRRFWNLVQGYFRRFSSWGR